MLTAIASDEPERPVHVTGVTCTVGAKLHALLHGARWPATARTAFTTSSSQVETRRARLR